MSETKVCTKCGIDKPLDEYYTLDTVKDGRHSECKVCNRKAARRWQKANPEKKRELNRDWARRSGYNITPGRRAYMRQYYKDNIERGREARRLAQKRWRQNNPEEYKQKYLKANASDSGRARAKAGNRKRRAAKMGANENFTIKMDMFARAFWRDKCAVCGMPQSDEGNKFPIDHWLPLEKGHALTMNTAVLMCPHHNGQKYNHMPEDVYGEATLNDITIRLEEQVMAWEWDYDYAPI